MIIIYFQHFKSYCFQIHWKLSMISIRIYISISIFQSFCFDLGTEHGCLFLNDYICISSFTRRLFHLFKRSEPENLGYTRTIYSGMQVLCSQVSSSDRPNSNQSLLRNHRLWYTEFLMRVCSLLVSVVHLQRSAFRQGSHRDWKTWKMKMVMEKSWNIKKWP